MPSNFFQTTWSTIDTSLSTLSNISSALCSAVLPVVGAALVIQIMWQGFNILRGQGGSNHILDVFAKSLRVMIVAAVALEAGSYNTWIVGMISGSGGLTDSILTAINSAPNQDPFSALDTAFDAGWNSYKTAELWGLTHLIVPHLYWIGFDLEFPGPTVLLANGIFFILFIIMLVLAFADLVVNSFALAIIFALGPVFLACYAFEATAQYAQSWLSGALKWAFTNIVIILVINIMIAIVNTFVTTVDTAGNDGQAIVGAIFGEIMGSVALMILCGKAHQIAADFVGGIGVSGFAQKMGQIASGMTKGGAKGFMTGGPMGALKGAAQGAYKGFSDGGGGGGGFGGGKGLGANFLNNMGGGGK